jgi:uncharacterized RDD family membrane protein YckC
MSNLPALRLDEDAKKAAYEWPESAFEWIILRRIVAFAFDFFFLALLVVPAHLAMAIGGLMTFGLLWIFQPILFLILVLSYHTLTIGSSHSATLGMRIMGVEVRSWDGGRPDYARALLHSVIFYMTAFPTGFTILIVALFTKNHRTIHEILSGTVTIRRIAGLSA